MAVTHRILAASPRRDLFEALQNETSRHKNWRISGPVNLREPGLFDAACRGVDTALIEAEDLLWLVDNRSEAIETTLARVQIIVILWGGQLLDVVTLPEPPQGFLLRRFSGQAPVGLLALALDGYLASPEPLLLQMMQNHQRLEIVEMLDLDELRILDCLGRGLPNRAIAEMTELAESRVKTLVHMLTRKLRMNNRTAVAVFAATNGLSDAVWTPDNQAG